MTNFLHLIPREHNLLTKGVNREWQMPACLTVSSTAGMVAELNRGEPTQKDTAVTNM